MCVIGGVWGCEAQRELAQLGGGVAGAAPAGQARGLVEAGGDGCVGPIDRERELAGALLGVGDDLAQSAVQRAAFGGEQER